MKDYCKYVNVFQGVDEIDLPKPEGVAAAWKFIKGLCGNNSPAAALPFGRLMAGCYDSGYSAGYGTLRINSHGPIGKIYDHNQFKGIAHIQDEGTGSIGTYYNYAVVSPFVGDLAESAKARDFDQERAVPGYYACRDLWTMADCEVTVTHRAALHRISFPQEGGKVSIDFSNDGLYPDDFYKVRTAAGAAELTLVNDHEVAVCAELHNLPVYFYVKVEGIKGALRLWVDDQEISEKEIKLEEGRRFGVVMDAEKQVAITLGFSPKNAEIAKKDALNNTLSFDEAREAAAKLWNEAFSRIDVEFDNDRDYEIFYSNFYHTLIKPCDFNGESFYYDEEEFVLEFATIWDQYKTQLPLLFAVYPDLGRKIVATFLHVAEATKQMPHTLMMCGNFGKFSNNQARMLAEHSIVDAYFRGVSFDQKRALRLMVADTFENNQFDEVVNNVDEVKSKAFIIDITDGCAACAKLAREMGEIETAERFEKVAAKWVDVFDPNTALLKDGERFYEGTKWNYSFRLMHDMEKRMALAGGKEGFAALADRFFGFVNPESEDACFEGFNNETDMETPYVYHYAGRHDRLTDVIDASLTYMFTTGRGGLPGNNDSGGLTSCYMCNAMGLFPVSGQDLVILTSPWCKRSVTQLANGKQLTVTREGEGRYIKEAFLNGKKLDTLAITAREMMLGGELVMHMTEKAEDSQLA